MTTKINEKSSQSCCRKAYIRYGVGIALVFVVLATINTPTGKAAPPDAKTCAFLKRFHGHTCPGSLMGLRLGLAAKEALKASGRLQARCFVLACPVDGIQVGVGTTWGNKGLEVEDENDMRLILTEVESGRKVEARLTKEAVEKGKTYRDLSEKARSHAAGSPERMGFEMDIEAVLNWFRTAPDSELVTVKALN
jgi:formylmethanofuran dehydrogenase subunit E